MQQVRRALLVRPVLPARLDRREPRVHRDRPACKARRAPPDRQVLRAFRELRERRDLRVRRVFPGQQAQPDRKERKARPACRARPAKPARPAPPDRQDLKACRG